MKLFAAIEDRTWRAAARGRDQRRVHILHLKRIINPILDEAEAEPSKKIKDGEEHDGKGKEKQIGRAHV